ncbi:ABC transporter permease [Clostridium vincentii]|uniref:ABC-2 family transporter protein n=1 Tax=Clostridium vincentii TaxID=52704 RepID=A0A2T0BBF5_9CLOT|nr:ABC transporter permease [Clostridium vincentii]PRR81230.1 ABC-2 family transporter protein [Clostridium vincentii]
MNIIPQIRKNIISLFKQEKGVLISFIILPLIMALIYGMMLGESFDGQASIDPIRVDLRYNNTSEIGEILDHVLEDEGVKSFIDVDGENYECEVTISDDFQNIEINNIKATSEKINILSSFFKSFNSDVQQVKAIYRNVEKGEFSQEEKGMIMGNILQKLNENQKQSSIEEKKLSGYKTLDSKEYYGISTFSFTAIMLIIVLSNKFFDEKQQGVVRRTFAAPISNEEYIIGFLLSSTIVAFIINIIYVLVNIAMGLSFRENFGGVIFIVIIQSILQGAISTLVIAFIKNKMMVNTIIGFFIVLSAVAGGAFYNIDSIESPFLKVLGNISPNTLILNAYKSLAISNSLKETLIYIIPMIIISLVFIILSMVKVKVRWER